MESEIEGRSAQSVPSKPPTHTKYENRNLKAAGLPLFVSARRPGLAKRRLTV
jgi:hypothetical protein